MSYRPLPEEVTIGKSEVEGLGLFATMDLKEGDCLGISHNVINGILHRTPLGGFYNHSDTPNMEKIDTDLNDTRTVFRLHIIKDVKKGEELTCDYSFYKI